MRKAKVKNDIFLVTWYWFSLTISMYYLLKIFLLLWNFLSDGRIKSILLLYHLILHSFNFLAICYLPEGDATKKHKYHTFSVFYYFIRLIYYISKMNLKNVKNRLKDETLDLSLCDLKEVPVREIVCLKIYIWFNLTHVQFIK